MAYVVYKGESKVAELVGRAYGELKAADRQRAEAVLLRANPQLAKIKDLSEGSLIVVPPVPGVPVSAEREVEAPAAEAVGEVAEALTAYRDRLEASAKTADGALSDLEQLLKSRGSKLRENPDAVPYLDRVTEAVEERRTENDERIAIVERIADAEKRLAELAERLG
jgi:hypothetical protein